MLRARAAKAVMPQPPSLPSPASGGGIFGAAIPRKRGRDIRGCHPPASGGGYSGCASRAGSPSQRSEYSYLKESDTRVRNAATFPSSTFMSIFVTSATRRSRIELAAVWTCFGPPPPTTFR